MNKFKTIISKLLLFIISIFLLALNDLQAQQQEFCRSKAGIGVSANTSFDHNLKYKGNFELIDLFTNIYITFDINAFLRIEPVFDFWFEKSFSHHMLGMGIFGKLNKNNLTFLYGVRGMRYKEKLEYCSPHFYNVFAPCIGLEYLFGNHLSLACEADFVFIYNKSRPDDKAKYMTKPAIIFRFYF